MSRHSQDADHILIVEDEPVTRSTLSGYLAKAGYQVSEAQDGREMWSALDRANIDLILLDINLPGEDGLSLLRHLRRSSDLAVILVTGKTDSVDKIVGLELGAHDYVTKPFNARELLARARNLIRLSKAAQRGTSSDERVSFEGWVFDKPGRALTSPEGENVPLTRGEFDLLTTLVENCGRVMTRDSLLDHVANREREPNDRSIDVLVGRLRRKIEADPKRPTLLKTVHGVGYVFTGTRDRTWLESSPT